MTKRSQRLQPALAFRGPAASNVARHRIIDDIVRAALAKNPTRRIILLGAGLDTASVPPHRRPVVGVRRRRVYSPSRNRDCPRSTAANPLTRTPVDFSQRANCTTIWPRSPEKMTRW